MKGNRKRACCAPAQTNICVACVTYGYMCAVRHRRICVCRVSGLSSSKLQYISCSKQEGPCTLYLRGAHHCTLYLRGRDPCTHTYLRGREPCTHTHLKGRDPCTHTHLRGRDPCTLCLRGKDPAYSSRFLPIPRHTHIHTLFLSLSLSHTHTHTHSSESIVITSHIYTPRI